MSKTLIVEYELRLRAEPPALQIEITRQAPSEPTFTPNHRKHNKRGKFKRRNR